MPTDKRNILDRLQALYVGDIDPSATRDPRKYTGALAKRIPTRSRLPTGWARERWRLLCEHHGVEFGDWFKLSLALAQTHVPGFQFQYARKGPRPSIRKQIARMQRKLEPRGPGRPQLVSAKGQRELVKHANDWIAERRKVGAKPASDRAYIHDLCKQVAQKTGERESTVIKEEAVRWIKRLSRARRTVTKS